MDWYYVREGEKVGPISDVEFQSMAAGGTVGNDTLVWNKTMKDWTRYADLPSTLGAALAAASVVNGPTCSMCGKEFAEDELIEFEGSRICANCKPSFVQQIKENSEISGVAVMRYAGFWPRFGAVFIDGIIMSLINLPANLGFQVSFARVQDGAGFIVLSIVLYVSLLLVPALYMILMHGKYGATLGKKAVGVRVVKSDGSPISYRCAIGRYFAYVLSGIILYIGYLMAAFDGEKRALHDHICNTRVIYK